MILWNLNFEEFKMIQELYLQVTVYTIIACLLYDASHDYQKCKLLTYQSNLCVYVGVK